MHKAILIGLGAAAAIGLIFLATHHRPGAPGAKENREAPASPNNASTAPATPAPAAAPGATSLPLSPPSGPGRTAASPQAPEPDPRIDRIDGKVYLNDPIALTRRMHSSATTPAEDVSAVGTALHYYKLVFKQNPVGSLNAEIVSQLIGDNPKKIVVIPPDHPDINADGELLDRWGTPYFFHGLTRTAMDVWSAGPDEKFGTIDDVKLGVDEEFREPLGLAIDP